MTIVDLQAWAAARITSNPNLAALGAPFIFSPFDDEVATRAAHETRARETGVVIEIGYPETGPAPATDRRGISEPANFEVYLREELSVAHSPNSLELLTAVKAALSHSNDPREPGAKPDGGIALTESGYILHVLSFSKNVTIP